MFDYFIGVITGAGALMCLALWLSHREKKNKPPVTTGIDPRIEIACIRFGQIECLSPAGTAARKIANKALKELA